MRIQHAGTDLESYRVARGLTYDALSAKLGFTSRSVARKIAIGEVWPGTERIDVILRRTDGAVTVDAMHRRRCAYLMSIGKMAPREPSAAE